MRDWLPLVVGLALVVLTILAYLPGLGGPFLFDDTPNIIKPLSAWLDGRSNWMEFTFGNHSGPLGRVVSMLSFAANGATTGLDPWAFKASNLAIHLMCGGLIYLLLARLLRRDPLLATKARFAAGLIAAIWLLHPIQVSTVLYVVQRMAELSALFALLALLAFVAGRESLQAGRKRQGCVQLFILVPACTLLAVFSKENGILVPLLCGVIELAYFRPRVRQGTCPDHCQSALRLFLGGFIVLPLLAGGVFLLVNPEFFLHGYDVRLFTLGERLLSQPRALMSYVGILLFPRGAALGVYTDDFPISHGLLDPVSTLWAILALLAWMLASVLLKRRAPAFFAGTWLYFGGHALESTIFPLEIYFEHRNYLPSLGIFLAVAGILGLVLPHLRDRLPERSTNRLLPAAAILCVVLLAGATAVRSSVWSSFVGIAEQGVLLHPTSLRAHFDKTTILLAIDRPEKARKVMFKMLDFPNPAAYSTAALYLTWLDCKMDGKARPAGIARIKKLVGRKLQLVDLFAGENLGNLLMTEDCDGLSQAEFAFLLRDMTASAQQPPSFTPVWRLRFMASRLFAAAGMLPLAIEQSALAWMSGGADPAVGVYLINLYLAVGDRKSAEILLPQVRKHIAVWDERNQQQLAKVLAYFADDSSKTTHRLEDKPLPAPGDIEEPGG